MTLLRSDSTALEVNGQVNATTTLSSNMDYRGWQGLKHNIHFN